MLIPYIGEFGAALVVAVLLVVLPLALFVFARQASRPAPPEPSMTWRSVNQPWSED